MITLLGTDCTDCLVFSATLLAPRRVVQAECVKREARSCGLVTALLGVLGVLGAGCGSGSSPAVRVSLPEPGSVTEKGVVYRVHAVSPTAFTPDTSDPQAVTIYVFQGQPGASPGCVELRPSTHVDRENSRTVVISTFSYGIPDPGPRSCSYFTTKGGPKVHAALRLRLPSPLGTRQLIDAKSGKPIGVVGAQQPPTPQYVPAGYTQTLTHASSPDDDSFIGIRQFVHGRSTLTITIQSATAATQSGKTVDHTEVAGVPAVVTDGTYERCVTWTDSAALVRAVCSGNSPAQFLSSHELIRVANSLD